MGVWVQRGLDGECFGEGIGVPLGVLTGDGHSVSFGTKSLSSLLSKGEIIGSTGITLLDFLVRSVGSSDCLFISLSLFSCSRSSSSCSLSLCQTMCCKMNPAYSSETPSAFGH